MKHIFIASILSLAWIGQAGDGNVIIGNGVSVTGNGNSIRGSNDVVNGNFNVQIGDQSSILGNNNVHVGNNQQIIGNNQVLGNGQFQVNPLVYNQGTYPNVWSIQPGQQINNLGPYFQSDNLSSSQQQNSQD